MTLSTIVLVSGASTTAIAQTNSWLHPSSGNWHDAHWSAGVLPGANQFILITNDNSKTVRIGPDTAQNYPETLRIGSLTVSSSGNSINTLLLDSTGIATPLSVWSSLIDAGGAFVLIGSAIETGGFDIRGSVAQGKFSEVKATGDLRLHGNAVYHLTNGILRTYRQDIGLPGSPGTFNQYGGTNLSSFFMSVKGIYNLTDGRLQVRYPGYAVAIGGTLNQSGGVVDATLVVGPGGWGYYNLSGGLRTGGPTLVGPGAYLGGGRIVQTGGTNAGGAIQMVPHVTYSGEARESSYIFSGGEVRSTTVTIAAFATFAQAGGTHINETISLSSHHICRRHQPGYPHYPDCRTVHGRYSLKDGVLVSSSIGGSSGVFGQSGGRLTVNRLGTTFSHDGGELIVNDLAVGSFQQGGGELTVTNITVRGDFSDKGGALNHHGWIAFNGGEWWAKSGKRRLGPMTLGESQPSRIFFPTNASLLRFADSSAMDWSRDARLIVRNWNGSWNGGGRHRLRVGTRAHALTPQQVSQIYFENPAGCQGLYPARILANGELVPRPMLLAEKTGARLTLRCPPGFILQTATNVNGPFVDVPAAVSSSTIQLTDPCRFFRLRPEAQ